MATHSIRIAKTSEDQLLFKLQRVPRDGRSIESTTATLKLIVGPGDARERVAGAKVAAVRLWPQF